jgi:hypothetical protein
MARGWRAPSPHEAHYRPLFDAIAGFNRRRTRDMASGFPTIHSHPTNPFQMRLLGELLRSMSIRTRMEILRHWKLVQRRVIFLGLFEDRDVLIGVLPKCEEVLIGSLCLDLVS